jgi:hypothetical protein
MTAHLVFTETGPILILTSSATITEGSLLDSLQRRGIDKFIAYEVPVDEVQRIYGVPFEVVAAEIEHGKSLRVLDFNGPHIFETFALSDLGQPVRYEH